MYKAVRLFNYKDGLKLEQDALAGLPDTRESIESAFETRKGGDPK